MSESKELRSPQATNGTIILLAPATLLVAGSAYEMGVAIAYIAPLLLHCRQCSVLYSCTLYLNCFVHT